MSVEFSRLFSMGGFEALRVVRVHQQSHPSLSIQEAASLSSQLQADTSALDFEAAEAISNIVTHADAASDPFGFYQACIEALILTHRPLWIKMMYQGRKFTQKLSEDEQQCFKGAGLMEKTVTPKIISWWDRMNGKVRMALDQEKLERGRSAEQLTLEFEARRLNALGIPKDPIWTAFEDNQVGYDVHSYDPGTPEPVARLIEVKSTIASPLRFYVSRNEWNQAVKFGAAYHFHVWNLGVTPPVLHQRTSAEIAPHIPTDQQKGQWTQAIIPVGT